MKHPSDPAIRQSAARLQSATLSWQASGEPVSTRFDDPYFTAGNGLAETQHVFLAGNDLPARLRPGFHIAELGVGTGMNLLAAWDMARNMDIPLRYTGFEGFPMTAPDLTRALTAFPNLQHLAEPWAEAWATDWPDDTLTWSIPDELEVTVIAGDVRDTLPLWLGRADAWFLDGFAPAKNPEMWEDALMHQVAKHTAPQGTFATYTAAGAVRRALAEAGFAVERIPGFGRKRHMTKGQMP
ncbi:tRNA (5-methylaminomethyl-2-thiouridine)(34)-methyltransferase MnmD [Alphaproteobacteria bacterium KMM 3653]|uniref:tRNA (5-methylaminomethyl-2-thiouridine)(34)-methyltransferase MnmD n=1 Tax=Harenicola maris TaxID=2841044 RepID=A0AAP2CVX4_9RHOB|nr:tRNA (5-methylaminomethyl-2-thiouridine)(34)-methyltransferase MnmD [Harenicola maris]